MPTLPGGAEWIIILLIVLLLFGAKKLPGLASSVGQSMREFRKASKEALEEEEEKEEGDDAPASSSERDSDA